MDFKHLAEELIYKGASIIPVKDKRPYIPKWSEIRGEDILDDIYTVQWKKANGMGIICGEASGVICLDIDINKTDEKLKAVLEQIEELLPPIFCGLIGNPERPPARFFKYNNEAAQKFINIGVEILSDGNQKVIPPSQHPAGQTYQWVGKPLNSIELDDLPDLPQELLEVLKELDEAHKPKKTAQTKTSKKPNQPPAATELKTEPGRCKSGSHNYLSKLAVALFHQHMPTEKIIERVLQADAIVNEDSDYLYFECKSRPWKTNNIEENAKAFVQEIENRNIEKRNDTYKEIHEVLHDDSLMRNKLANGMVGGLINNLYNVRRLIELAPGIGQNLWYDTFHYKFMGKKGNGEVVEWTDEHDLELCVFMQQHMGLPNLKDETVRKARIIHSMQNLRNEPKEWIESLTWDGTDRINTFFSQYMGAEDGDYTRSVSHNFWVSMVARIMKPGCKVDNMVILEGEQGVGKSTALNIIGGKWYVESNEPLGSKDFCQITHGNLIIEIGELDSFSKAESTTIKKVISTAVDRFRAPYARSAKDYPRQCIFVGTTNDTDYLKDATGGRRFWPVACNTVKYDDIKRDREQLFAEALVRYKAGMSWHEVPDVAKVVQESRTEQDPWQDDIERYLKERESMNAQYVTVAEVLTKCLEFDLDKMDRRHSLRVGKVLRTLKWNKKKSVNIDGIIHKGFFKKMPDY